MKKNRKAVSKNEMMKGKWKRQIMLEKDYTEQCSEWMAERLEALNRIYAIWTCSRSLYETGRNIQTGERNIGGIRKRFRKAV